MSNASTIRRQVNGTQQLTIAAISAPGTTETNFTLNNNGLTGTGGGVIPLTAGVTGLYAGTGQVLVIRAAGSFAGYTGSDALTIKLYEVPAAIIAAGGLTATSNTGFNLVHSSGSVTVSNAAGAFSLVARLQLDSAGNLNGSASAEIDTGTFEGPAVISGAANVKGLVGEADLNFVLSITAGSSVSTLVANLNEFAIDLE